MQFSDEQRKQVVGILITAFISIVVSVMSVYGYDITIKPLNRARLDQIVTTPVEAQAVDTYSGTVGDIVSKSRGGLFEGNVQFEDFFGGEEGDALVLTEGATITPISSYSPITASAAVTTSTTTAIYSGTTTGDLLWIVNESANDIIIDDAANTNLSGNTTLGTADTLLLMWDGTDWLELGQADN